MSIMNFGSSKINPRNWKNPFKGDSNTNDNEYNNDTSRQTGNGRQNSYNNNNNNTSRQNNNYNDGQCSQFSQNTNYGVSRQNNRSIHNNGNSNYNHNNGRQSNYDNYNIQHNHAHNHQHQHQAQRQSYANNQMQETAQTETFIEQVDNTVICLSLAGESFQKGEDEQTVDLLSDAAVVALNLFAVSCEYLHQEKNKDALELGRKQVIDKFTELQSRNHTVYELIEPHRNFIDSALNGQKNLRYKEARVQPGVKALFERGPAEINKGFGKMIHHQQQYDKSRDALLEEQTNKKLAKQHQSALNEYRNNDKYQDINKIRNKSNKSSKSGSKKARAKIRDLYPTESGKKSQFVNSRAVKRANQEEKAMDEDVYGPEPDTYDELLKRNYLNAVLKLSPQYSWNDINEPIPCQILVPSKNQKAKLGKDEVKILPCYPHNNCTLNATLDILELDNDEIKKIENQYIKNLRKYSKIVPNPPLGYKSIDEQDTEPNNPTLMECDLNQ